MFMSIRNCNNNNNSQDKIPLKGIGSTGFERLCDGREENVRLI